MAYSSGEGNFLESEIYPRVFTYKKMWKTWFLLQKDVENPMVFRKMIDISGGFSTSFCMFTGG